MSMYSGDNEKDNIFDEIIQFMRNRTVSELLEVVSEAVKRLEDE